MHRMEPFHETIRHADARYPLRVFTRSSVQEHVYAHPHWHAEYEILLIRKGSGTQQTGAHISSFGAGDILPIPCNAVHATYTDEWRDNEILVITFPWDFPWPGLSTGVEHQLLRRFQAGGGMPAVIHPQDDPDGILRGLLEDVAAEWAGAVPGRELLVRARMLELVVRMARVWQGGGTDPAGGRSLDGEAASPAGIAREARIRTMLQVVFDRIDRDFSKPLRVADAAKTASLSVSQLERLFRTHTGQTFSQYLNRYRVVRAMGLFDTDATMTEIALSCGFETLSSFSRAFRRIKGVAPSVLRRGGTLRNQEGVE